MPAPCTHSATSVPVRRVLSTRFPGYSGPGVVAPLERVSCGYLFRMIRLVVQAFVPVSRGRRRRRHRGRWPFCIGVWRLWRCGGDVVADRGCGCGYEYDCGIEDGRETGGSERDDGGDGGDDGAGEIVSLPRLDCRSAHRRRHQQGLVTAVRDGSFAYLICDVGADGRVHRLRRRMLLSCLLRSWTRHRRGRPGGGGRV